MDIATLIELLAVKAVRRIEREGKFASSARLARAHALSVRSAQEALDAHTRSSVHHQNLHNRINALVVERGLARWNGAALVASAAAEMAAA